MEEQNNNIGRKITSPFRKEGGDSLVLRSRLDWRKAPILHTAEKLMKLSRSIDLFASFFAT